MNTLYQQNAISAYNQAVRKTPQASNVVILYDAVLRHLTEARKAYDAGQRSQMIKLISRANLILVELQKALRSDLSKPLFEKLDTFYGSNIIRISQQPQKKFEDDQFRSLLSSVRTVRNAWAEVAGMSVRKGVKETSSTNSVRLMG